MKDKQMLKSIKALAKSECANYSNGFCLMTGERCHVINPDYDTIHDGAIDCDYFMDCVLPADWELNDLIWYAIWADDDADEDEPLPDGMRLCANCQRPFIPTNGKQKYCKSCAATVNRTKAKERMAHKRRLVG